MGFSWGVDGFGVKWFLCDYCELEFGSIKPVNECGCDKSRPRYHNRGIKSDSYNKELSINKNPR